MSNPLDQDFGPDEPSRYAPKKLRTAHEGESRRSEADREQDAGAYGPEQRAASARYRVPRSLEPTLVPEPYWPDARSRSGAGVMIRIAGAAAVAAVVALFVVGKVPTSWMSTASGKAGPSVPVGSPRSGPQTSELPLRTSIAPERSKLPIPQLIIGQALPQPSGQSLRLNVSLSVAAPGAMVIIDGLATGSTLTVGRASRQSGWRLMAADLGDALIRPPQDFQGSMDLAVELRLADDSVADRKAVHAEWTAPPPPPPAPKPAPAIVQLPATPPTPAAPGLVIRQLERQEVAALVRRGEDFIASGDLASARLVLQRAAESGDVRAALALAGTYDPNVLEKLGAQALAADIVMARIWYQRAREFGSIEAPRRLELLARASSTP
jgi:hypothetical protein